ncbi:MAG: leucine-rich repeat domain-containing protein [Prevotellaceae bacterium]|nr:leucine-rich repeat domain-containing protein [Prevotellaceae bacterium]
MRKFFTLLLLIVCCTGLYALPAASTEKYDLELTVKKAGTLDSLVDDDVRFTVTSLKIHGPLNSDDVLVLRDMCGIDENNEASNGKVTRLDLSDARFVEGGKAYLSFFSTDTWEDVTCVTHNDEFPAYMFGNNSQGCAMTEVIMPKGTKAIGDHAFGNTASLTSVVIPDSVETIGANAFAGSGLEAIVIPKQVTKIGTYAFWGCAHLTDIAFEDTLTEIPEGLLSQTAITEFDIPETVTKIGTAAFKSCAALKTITGGRKVKSIGTYAFYGASALESLVLGDSLKSIGGCALSNLSALKEINIPAKVNYIAMGGFYTPQFADNALLEKITVDPANADYADQQGILFTKDGTKLIACPAAIALQDSTFEVSEGTQEIAEGAFQKNLGIATLILPSTLTTIDNSAFDFCVNLRHIISHAVTPPSFNGWESFSLIDKSKVTLEVPAGSEAAYEKADQWKDFSHVVSTGIHALSSSSSVSPTLYNLRGQQVSRSYHGLVIKGQKKVMQ